MTSETITQYKTSKNLHARGNLHATYATKNWFSWVAGQLKLKPGARILDTGCGAGWFWLNFIRNMPDNLPEGLNLVLHDQSERMVEEAASQLSGAGKFASITASVGDAVDLQFKNGSFDQVIAMHMMYHVQDQSKAIAEFVRVLGPDGQLFISTNGPNNLSSVFELGHLAFEGPKTDPAVSLFSPDKAQALILDHFKELVVAQFVDEYAIKDALDILAYLTSMPPGDSANPEQLKNVEKLFDDKCRQNSGVFPTGREAFLIRGTRC